MTLSPLTPCQLFEIQQPRWHDRTVLLAAHKIGTHNEVLFTHAPSLGTGSYYVSGVVAKKFPKSSNGKIDCYQIPLSELEPLERI